MVLLRRHGLSSRSDEATRRAYSANIRSRTSFASLGSVHQKSLIPTEKFRQKTMDERRLLLLQLHNVSCILKPRRDPGNSVHMYICVHLPHYGRDQSTDK